VADVDAAARLLTALTGLASDEAPPDIPPTPPDPVPPAATGGDPALEALAALIATPGVAGHESDVRAEIQKRLPAWAQAMAEVDRKGNLVVRMGAPAGTGTSARPLLFVAHMDEVGFEVTGVRDDGTATVRGRGGMYLSLYEGQPMLVATPQGPVAAVMAPRARYAAATAGQPAIDDLVLFFGTTTAAATRALGVAEAQPATIRKRLQPLAGRRATGRAMDDRVGSTALLLALQQIDPARLTREVTFAWVVEEETGLAGAQAMVEALERPYTAFAIDTFVSSDAPLDSRRVGQAPLGGGAVLRGLDSRTLVRAPIVDRILRVASEAGVTLQVGVTSGGTDASAFNQTGAIDVGLSWPGRYSHSPVEVMDRGDLDALVKAIVALANGY
jgi:putative aminopeptidase FrvX